jgi:geranylgeranyl pyrophosphate synthase
MDYLLTNPIQERLQQVEALIIAQVDSSRSNLAAALYHLISAGGKRIRPRLALLTGSMLGGDQTRLVALAAAIELLHTATLIHDDLIDNSSLRRGAATLNAHFSASATVLAGDFAYARAAGLAAKTDSLAVIRLFAETLAIMTEGELTQAGREPGAMDREGYYRWIQAKTASLFELACGAAALLSPVDQDSEACARKFGYEIGMAFQITDDVLDFTGDPRNLGKPTGNDLRQGVITLPAIYYLEKHPDYPMIQLDGVKTEQLIAEIRKNGSIQQAMREAEDFVERGLSALAKLPDTPERKALAEMAGSIVRREA